MRVPLLPPAPDYTEEPAELANYTSKNAAQGRALLPFSKRPICVAIQIYAHLLSLSFPLRRSFSVEGGGEPPIPLAGTFARTKLN